MPYSPEKQHNQIKSFIIVTVLRRSVNELAGPISPSLRLGNTAPFKKMSQRRRAVSNTVSDLTGPNLNLEPPAPETNALPLDITDGVK